MKIDLHTHTTASDGKLTPTELIDLAIKRGIKAIAITDHNNINGIEEAVKYSQGKNIEFIPGIEFSANPGELDKEIHIVGLFIDYDNGGMIKLIERQREFGIIASKRIIKRLNNKIASRVFFSFVLLYLKINPKQSNERKGINKKTCSFVSISTECTQGVCPSLIKGFTSGP